MSGDRYYGRATDQDMLPTGGIGGASRDFVLVPFGQAIGNGRTSSRSKNMSPMASALRKGIKMSIRPPCQFREFSQEASITGAEMRLAAEGIRQGCSPPIRRRTLARPAKGVGRFKKWQAAEDVPDDVACELRGELLREAMVLASGARRGRK